MDSRSYVRPYTSQRGITNGFNSDIGKISYLFKANYKINLLPVSTLSEIKNITSAKTELSLAPNFAVLPICKNQNPIKIYVIS